MLRFSFSSSLPSFLSPSPSVYLCLSLSHSTFCKLTATRQYSALFRRDYSFLFSFLCPSFSYSFFDPFLLPMRQHSFIYLSRSMKHSMYSSCRRALISSTCTVTAYRRPEVEFARGTRELARRARNFAARAVEFESLGESKASNKFSRFTLARRMGDAYL